jgi:CRP-like cAMP-binding protein
MDLTRPAANPLLNEITEHPFFRGLPPEHLSLLADCAMRSHFEKDERIFRSGDPANRFYLLQKGKVALESATNGAATTLQHIGAGDVLGWSWLFPPYTWHFDARAVEPTDAIFLYGTRVRELCDSNHDLGYELMNRTANVLIDRLMSVRRELVGKC